MSRRINVGALRNLISTGIPLTRQLWNIPEKAILDLSNGRDSSVGHVNARTAFVEGRAGASCERDNIVTCVSLI